MDEIDKSIGERVRTQRVLATVTQKELGRNLGVSFQQIQKYEAGVNRVPASRVWLIAQALGVGVSSFFPSAPGPEIDQLPRISGSDLSFLRHFHALSDVEKTAVKHLLATLAAGRLP